ncbi:hypothetical protein [Fischerella thermalis]|nr:hypothetical protein [Fischerella thermalis]
MLLALLILRITAVVASSDRHQYNALETKIPLLIYKGTNEFNFV